jgi:rRNA maturation RNase YbeY
MPLQAGFLRQFCQKGRKRRNQLYLCDDEYLHKINLEYLKHDDLTDIISFDYTLGNEIHGDIFFCGTCSGKRGGFQSAFEEEIRRVMVHGVLHCGYKDKGEAEELLMRSKEDENWRCSTWNSKSYLVLSAAMFHVERVKDVII